MAWTVETFGPIVDEELEALPADMRARFVRFVTLIEAHGPSAMPGEAIKHLEGKLWELRISGRDGISRAIYITATGRRLVVLRVFVKKTRKTPLRELELARRRAREFV